MYLKGLHQYSLGDVGEEWSGELDAVIAAQLFLESLQIASLQLHIQLNIHRNEEIHVHVHVHVYREWL